VIGAFKKGLRSELQSAVCAARPKSMAEAIAIAAEFSALKAEEEKDEKVFTIRQANTCHKCGQSGHWAKNCYAGQRNNRFQGQGNARGANKGPGHSRFFGRRGNYLAQRGNYVAQQGNYSAQPNRGQMQQTNFGRGHGTGSGFYRGRSRPNFNNYANHYDRGYNSRMLMTSTTQQMPNNDGQAHMNSSGLQMIQPNNWHPNLGETTAAQPNMTNENFQSQMGFREGPQEHRMPLGRFTQ
jgi:Zinc knuckle